VGNTQVEAFRVVSRAQIKSDPLKKNKAVGKGGKNIGEELAPSIPDAWQSTKKEKKRLWVMHHGRVPRGGGFIILSRGHALLVAGILAMGWSEFLGRGKCRALVKTPRPERRVFNIGMETGF